jgi:hypothetical protein
MDKINTWWSTGPQPGNFGDILTPLIVKELFDHECVLTKPPFKTPTLLGIGSIISKAESNSIVWGSGMMRTHDPLKRDAKYLSVRGPHTYQQLKSRKIDCPPIFGDPALLMPMVYSPTVEKKYDHGIFAHYVDTEQVRKWYGNDESVLIIDPLNADPLKVIDQVLQCKCIISSSLHGIIIAHAYDIPATWVKHSDKLNGDGIKFQDHFSSVGLPMTCSNFTQKIPVDDFYKFHYTAGISIDLNKIKNALGAYLDER